MNKKLVLDQVWGLHIFIGDFSNKSLNGRKSKFLQIFMDICCIYSFFCYFHLNKRINDTLLVKISFFFDRLYKVDCKEHESRLRKRPEIKSTPTGME